MPKLSTIIITKNSAQKIKRALTSVQFSDEIIVVIDSTTTDDTAQIAKEMGANVFYKEWQGYGQQKNYGLEQAQSKWILFIDDDEEVTHELQQEIKHVIKNPVADVYWLRIVTIFFNKPLKHLYGHNPRLFKKDSAQWTNTQVHEQLLDKNNNIIKLKKNSSNIITDSLLHHSHRSLKSYLQKMHRYTTLDAREMIQTNKLRSGKPVKSTLFLPCRLAIKQFLKLLIYRRGILDGFPGIAWSCLSAYYELEMGYKYLKMSKK